MHKLKIILSGIILFALFNITNACTPRTAVNEGVYINGGIHPIGDTFTSSNNNAIDNGVFTFGNFYSEYLGNGKKLFAYDDKNFRFRDENGLPYFYGNDIVEETIFQGNPNGYYYCEEIDGNTSNSLTNCSYNDITTGSYNIFKTFFTSVTNEDYFAYLEERYFRETTYSSICISNSFVGHTVCFVIDSSYGCNGINSKNYTNLNFTNINENILYNSPAYITNTGGNNGNNTQNNYVCPTIQQLINTYGSQYNTGLCYSSSLIYSGGTIQSTTPKSIFELRPNYTGYIADINLYNTYCIGPNTTQACQTAFEGKQAEYSLIGKTPNDVNRTNLYQYCNLQLNYENKNATTCTLSGTTAPGIKETLTTQDIINGIVNGNYKTITPNKNAQNSNSGSAFNELLTEEQIENGGRENIEVNRNIIESFDELYTKITGIFSSRSGNNGIIPDYITRIFLIIVLFALFKI